MNVSSWILRVVAWDGILPLLVWMSPGFIKALAPKNQRESDALVVMFLVAILFLRFRAGSIYISSNNCTPGIRKLQFVIFCIAISWLLLVDLIMILMNMGPPPPVRDPNEPLAIFLILLGFYLAYFMLMLFAMYPGQDSTAYEEMIEQVT
jgi:hypothetical protein